MTQVVHLNPEGLPRNPAFSQGVSVQGPARTEDVVSWSILLVAGQSLQAGFAGFQQVWGARGNPPAISVAFVAGLASPQLLVEVSAVAVITDAA